MHNARFMYEKALGRRCCPLVSGELVSELIELVLDVKRITDILLVEFVLHFVEKVLDWDCLAILVLLELAKAANK